MKAKKKPHVPALLTFAAIHREIKRRNDMIAHLKQQNRNLLSRLTAVLRQAK